MVISLLLFKSHTLHSMITGVIFLPNVVTLYIRKNVWGCYKKKNHNIIPKHGALVPFASIVFIRRMTSVSKRQKFMFSKSLLTIQWYLDFSVTLLTKLWSYKPLIAQVLFYFIIFCLKCKHLSYERKMGQQSLQLSADIK